MRGAGTIRNQHGLPALDQLGGDLTRLPRWEVVTSLALPWLCLAIYVLAALAGWWPVAVLGVVMLSFFTYGSISHDLVHQNLGLPRPVNTFFLSLTELLAVRSGHAYRMVHLHHHARFPAADDVEGAAADMSLVGALLRGLVHQLICWVWAVRQGRGPIGLIWFEGIACVLIVIGSVVLWPATRLPAAYVALVVMGSWIIPLITSYIPHAPKAASPLGQTRLFRGYLVRLIAIEHLYHLEHHLYPQVPHHHWARLAKRLDPHFRQAGITPMKLSWQDRSHDIAD